MEQETGGTGLGHRSVGLTRVSKGVFDVTNVRGGVMRIGGGETSDFTPVELFLAAIAGCSAVDVDFITAKRAEPESFTVEMSGEKLRDEQGNHMGGLTMRFSVTFPEGEGGDAAREILPRTIQQIQDRLCTVARTVTLGDPVAYAEGKL